MDADDLNNLSDDEVMKAISDELKNETADVHSQDVNTGQENGDVTDTAAPDIASKSKRLKPATPLQATTYLMEISLRVEDVISELKHIASNLSSGTEPEQQETETAARASRSEIVNSLEKSLIPFLTLAIHSIFESATLLSPITGAKILQKQQDVQWKREVLDESTPEDTRRKQLKFIDAFISSCYLNEEEFWTKNSEKKQSSAKGKQPVNDETVGAKAPEDITDTDQTTNTDQAPEKETDTNKTTEQDQTKQISVEAPANSIYARVNALQLPDVQVSEDKESVILPLPLNGSQYTKIETIAILTRCKTRLRKRIMKEMIAKEYVPTGIPRLYDMLRLYDKCIKEGDWDGGIHEAWLKPGRPTLEAGTDTKRRRPSTGEVKNKPKKKARKNNESEHPKPQLPKEPTVKPKPPEEPIVLLFPPKNGSYYLKSEFLQIVTPHPYKSNTRGRLIKHMLKNKLVQATKITVYHLLRDYENNPDYVIKNDEWGAAGRPKAFSEEDISNLARYIHANPQSYSVDDVYNLLMDIARKRLENNGVNVSSSEDPVKISRRSVRQYMVDVASKLEILDGSIGNGRKSSGGVFKYIDGKLILGRVDEDKGGVEA